MTGGQLVFTGADRKLYRFEVPEVRVKKSDVGKYMLPDKIYSKGFYERVSNGDWNELPLLSEERIRRLFDH